MDAISWVQFVAKSDRATCFSLLPIGARFVFKKGQPENVKTSARRYRGADGRLWTTGAGSAVIPKGTEKVRISSNTSGDPRV